jgi:hypothetical protein
VKQPNPSAAARDTCLTSTTCPAIQRLQAAAHQERSQYIHALVRRFAERFVAPLQRAVKPCC